MANILITGANKGIGLQLTSQYASAGNKVFACCRSPESATELNELAKSNDVQIIKVSIGDAVSVAEMASQLKGVPIDILINNAGTGGPKSQSVSNMDFEGWADTFNINAMAPLRILQALKENLSLPDTSKVVTITSQMGAISLDMTVAYAYCASKAALNKVMKLAAIELAKENIQVCVIHPGWVQTDMGGPTADLTATDSAAGIINVVTQLNADNTGGFWKWNGETHAW
ncbi:MAG: SDR family oxidoreductase [Pseudomonadales bacterium]|nr:SDR family oxidoreductase [Pseudomonadales bacterium]